VLPLLARATVVMEPLALRDFAGFVPAAAAQEKHGGRASASTSTARGAGARARPGQGSEAIGDECRPPARRPDGIDGPCRAAVRCAWLAAVSKVLHI